MKNILRKKYSHEEDSGPRAVRVDGHGKHGETKEQEAPIDKKKLVLARAMKNILKRKQEKSLQHQEAVTDDHPIPPPASSSTPAPVPAPPVVTVTPKVEVKKEEPKVEIKVDHVEEKDSKPMEQIEEKSIITDSVGEDKSDLVMDPKAESDDNTN